MNEDVASPRIERPRRSRSAGAVAFLFAVAQLDTLPGPVLVRLLGDLGLSESAARGQLSRMRQGGQLLVAQRHGRQVGYRLGGHFAVQFEQLRSYSPVAVPPWTGEFQVILYQIPETERAFRDRLRRTALLAGYGSLQAGVLIAATDLFSQISEVVAEAPPECVVHLGRLRVDDEAAGTLAWDSWRLGQVRDVFRGHLGSLTAALQDEPPPPSALALRRISGLLLGPAVDRLSDPRLPPELLPDDWPARQLLEVVKLVGDRYLPPAHSYVRSVLDGIEPD